MMHHLTRLAGWLALSALSSAPALAQKIEVHAIISVTGSRLLDVEAGAALEVTIRGLHLELLESADVIHDRRPTDAVTAELEAVDVRRATAMTERTLHLRARADAQPGDAYRIRLAAPSQRFSSEAAQLRVTASAAAHASAARLLVQLDEARTDLSAMQSALRTLASTFRDRLSRPMERQLVDITGQVDGLAARAGALPPGLEPGSPQLPQVELLVIDAASVRRAYANFMTGFEEYRMRELEAVRQVVNVADLRLVAIGERPGEESGRELWQEETAVFRVTLSTAPPDPVEVHIGRWSEPEFLEQVLTTPASVRIPAGATFAEFSGQVNPAGTPAGVVAVHLVARLSGVDEGTFNPPAEETVRVHPNTHPANCPGGAGLPVVIESTAAPLPQSGDRVMLAAGTSVVVRATLPCSPTGARPATVEFVSSRPLLLEAGRVTVQSGSLASYTALLGDVAQSTDIDLWAAIFPSGNLTAPPARITVVPAAGAAGCTPAIAALEASPALVAAGQPVTLTVRLTCVPAAAVTVQFISMNTALVPSPPNATMVGTTHTTSVTTGMPSNHTSVVVRAVLPSFPGQVAETTVNIQPGGEN